MKIVVWLALIAVTVTIWIFWGWRRVKRRIRDAAALSRMVTADESPYQGCMDVFRPRLDMELSIATSMALSIGSTRL